VILLLIISIVCLFLLTTAGYMIGNQVPAGWFILFLGVMYLLLTVSTSHVLGYRDGQVDAINGKLKYEITTSTIETTEVKLKEKP
jgi:hypothetical protein